MIHVQSGRLTPYAGGYDYYLDKSRAANARAALTAGFAPPPAGKPAPAAPPPEPSRAKRRPAAGELRRLRSEVGRLEQVVSELEAKQAELTAQLESPETYREAGRALHLNRELTATVDQLATATAEWEQAAVRLQEMESA